MSTNGSESRERLLDAASELLSSRATLDISLKEIAARSGLNHGLVTYYFGSKEGLLIALLQREASQALEALKRLVAMNMPPLDKLNRHIAGVINTYHRRPYINRLINVLQSGDETTARELSRIFIAPLAAYQAAILAEAIAAGQIVEVDPMLFYYTTIGACDFLFSSRQTHALVFGHAELSDDLRQSYAEHLTRLMLEGLRPRPVQA